MSVIPGIRHAGRLIAVLVLIMLFARPGELHAQGRLDVHPSFSTDPHSLKMVDVFNLFPNAFLRSSKRS